MLTAFVIHDRATLDGAAKRGAIYAAHCICDPNYSTIAGSSGELDMPQDKTFSFSGVGNNIEAYRYLFGSGSDVKNDTEADVRKILEKTRIPWRTLDVSNIKCEIQNKFLYQFVKVSVTAEYPVPAFFKLFGMDDISYTVSSTMTVNDPDEFIRNADLIVDLIAKLDQTFFGGKLASVGEKIGEVAVKIVDWFKK